MALILLADEAPASRDAVARALREHGHHVELVADGVEATERFHREHPEVAILDVSLPRMTGIEAAVQMKAAPGSLTRVVLASGRADLPTRLSALAVADDLVTKPCDPLEVCARVEVQLRTLKLLERRERAETDAACSPAAHRATHLGGEPPRSTPGATHPPSANNLTVRSGEELLRRLSEEWKRSSRTNEPMALLTASVDNAEPGSTEAERVLAECVLRCLRSIDISGRSEAGNLCVLLFNTRVTGAMAAVERLKRRLKDVLIHGVSPVVSVGVSFHPGRDVTGPAELLHTAETALARARGERPGLVCLYQNQLYVYDPSGAV